MKKIVIVAALPGELAPLVRGWEQRGRHLWAGRVAGADAIAIAGGMGRAAAERAVERALAEGAADMLISYGWVGALTCAVKPGDACAISEILDERSGERFETGYSKGFRLVTLDRVAHANEKRALAEKYQAVIVDMEASAVARMATARGIPFSCFKGVSDGYNDRLPDFLRFTDGRGELRMAAFLAYLAVHPGYWASIARLGKNSKAAAVAIAGMLEEYLRQS